MKKVFLVVFCALLVRSSASWADDATSQMKKALGRLPAAPAVPQYPSKTGAVAGAAGPWQWQTSSGWTSGFFPGTLWMLWNRTGGQDADLLAAAKRYTAGRASEANNTDTHDVGFMVYDSFGKGLEFGGTAALDQAERAAYAATVRRAAHSLATRYSPVVGMTRSWGKSTDEDNFEVIIDNLMNLELLFWAARNPGPGANASDAARLHDIAVSTARNMARFWVRPDGSTFHLVVFDPRTGAVKSRSGTPQGLATNSTWARGQAWAMYGFVMAHRYTGDTAFLQHARNVTGFYLRNTPADHVPKWDFSATAAWGGANRDTSAAAIAASALLELHGATGEGSDGPYLAAARATLAALGAPPYALPAAAGESLLSHCEHDCGDDGCDIIEADYFLVEARLRAERVARTGRA
eukprot:g3392.t1